MQSDEEAIFNEIIAFTEAWNKGDAKAAASFCTDDCVRVGAFGDVQHGQSEIEAAFEKLFQQTMTGAKVQQERGNVRKLTPELVIWQGGLEIIPNNGPSLIGHVVQVMKKVG